MRINRKCAFILYTFYYYIKILYLYYLKFRGVHHLVRIHY